MALSVGFSYTEDMNVPLKHLNALRAFEAAARHESLAQAARDLNVSHSVISQHIKTLEAWFGVPLFVRLGNKVALTDEGRELLPHISSAFQTMKDACYNILKKHQRASLNVVAESAIASRWLRKRINAFSEEFPRIDVDLTVAWKPPLLTDGQADIIVNFETRRPTSGAIHHQLFPLDCFPACSPEMYAKLVDEHGAVNFDALPLVHDHGKQIWQMWYAKYAPESENWKSGKIYSDFSMAIDAAVDGEGAILADDIICQREIASGALVPLDVRTKRCAWYSASVSKEISKSSSAYVFLSWLRAYRDA
ncbi:LysR family transcriptional regulator [Cognatishimia sp. 1_MG-2023]|uniref:LysR family transcriptional regulator n=1 Tax=Cognatishimia sp. 1_MG-2023 TaxID=3062642 RepID=UPI0026E1BF99|nr:LysR family transcriptional regulator [Cognatishimia sp. 1_MG-2023]MDO6728275.1 LysR family transcriptional regulator [Cognatishimia sp. 1_MG-2023]